MIKSVKNRKIISQTKRNFLLNQFYKKKIKIIQKKLLYGFTLAKKNNSTDKLKNIIIILLQQFFSILDKALKKGVIHKNYVTRRKANFSNKIITIY